MGGNGVEEVAVVAHDEYGTLCFCKIIFEPSYGIEVKVVGRFVQQKVIGFTKEGTSEEHAHFLLTADILHELVVEIFFDPKPAEKSCRITLGIPAV